MLNEQMPFSEIERQSTIALEAGALNKLQNILAPLLRDDDRTRSARENLFVYRTLGSMYHDQNNEEQSLVAYRQAHSFDPRDAETLEVLVEKELEKPADQIDTDLLLDQLIFHRDALKNSQIMRIFKLIGDSRSVSGKLDDAREYYEKALDVRPGDMELIQSLVKVSEASGNEEAVRKAREKLLNSLSSPESRAAVLVSIGDDYLSNLKDEKRALETYEEALAECAQSSAAMQRILVIAERSEDWDRALNALESLVKNSTEDEEKARYLLKMASIFKDKLNNTKRAIQLFNEVLDIKPEQTDVFAVMTNILMEQNDFLGLETNYEAMIDRQRHINPINTKMLAVYCKNLGDLRLNKLHNIPGAAQAYKVVSELMPNNVNIHMILAKLYAQSDDTLKEAIFENREILRLAPDKLNAVTDLAVCYRRLGKFDESLCIYRVLNILGMNDDTGKAIVAKFASDEPAQINDRLTEDILQLIRPETLDMNLVNLFTICTPIIGDLFSNELSDYGISRDALIDTTTDTMFMSTLKSQSTALGFGDVPSIYRCDKFSGVCNAYQSTRSFLVNSKCLSGRSAHEVAFLTAKALLLIRPEFYLLQQLGMQNVESILYAIIKTVVPKLNIELSKGQQKVSKVLASGLNSNDVARLTECVRNIVRNGAKLDIRLFMESVEDFGNRIGLLFSDDLSVINGLLSEEDPRHTISSRQVGDRIGSLLVWALSENYTKLRKRLNIAIAA